MLATALSAGCGAAANTADANTADANSADANSKLKLWVTTSFLEDMAEVLGGDSVEISCIIPRGEDPHFWFDQDLYAQAVSTMAATLEEKTYGDSRGKPSFTDSP